MRNKLGINEMLLLDVERKIINVKLNLLDERFTFDSPKMDIEYLKKINNFLFSDIYYEDELGIRDAVKDSEALINYYLDEIIYLSMYYKEEVLHILKLLQNIWQIQPFNIGNTRTLLGYLKNLNEAFKLGLEIDVNKEISSKCSVFELNNFVNQNRLTKNK